MRLVVILLISVFFTVGCGSRTGGASKVGVESSGNDSASAPPAENSKLVVSPINPVEGKVVLVRQDLRYLVADFSSARMPQPGSKLGLYRDRQKIGEVKITDRESQMLAQKVVADITTGEAAVGDVIRLD